MDDCTEGWIAPEETVDAELIIDLGCLTTIDTIELRNLNKNQGTKTFSIHLKEDEGWTELHTGTLTLEKDGAQVKDFI